MARGNVLWRERRNGRGRCHGGREVPAGPAVQFEHPSDFKTKDDGKIAERVLLIRFDAVQVEPNMVAVKVILRAFARVEFHCYYSVRQCTICLVVAYAKPLAAAVAGQ